MSSSSDTMDARSVDTSATEALENAVEESRREYDKKVETTEEIDDKAMRSVRTAVVLVGLVVSAVSVTGLGAVGDTSVLSVFVGSTGIVSLIVSIIYGIGVYSTTEYPTGIDSEHRAEVIGGGYGQKEWLVHMIDEYEEWSDKITVEMSRSLRYLELVQLSLSFGVIFLLLSASAIVAEAVYGVRPPLTLIFVLLLLLAVRTYIGDRD